MFVHEHLHSQAGCLAPGIFPPLVAVRLASFRHLSLYGWWKDARRTAANKKGQPLADPVFYDILRNPRRTPKSMSTLCSKAT